MFYLTTHSTHFIYSYMVKDHSDSERGNPLPPHRLLFPISSKGYFILHHPTDRIAHTTAFVTPVVEHWLEREITQWVHPMKDRSDDPSHHERTLLPRSYISLLNTNKDNKPSGPTHRLRNSLYTLHRLVSDGLLRVETGGCRLPAHLPQFLALGGRTVREDCARVVPDLVAVGT